MPANDKTIAHYGTGVQHWDLAASRQYDYFQGQITKYIDRWKSKGGIDDLKKAQHFLEKYIEVYEQYLPQPVPDFGEITTLFTLEGIWGSGEAMYTCKRCKEKVMADSPITAYRIHGECASQAYVDQG